MSRVICVMGESGSGKTTSCRNLNPKETYYIDADGKGLSWRGWRKQYNSEQKNYYRGTDVRMIRKILSGINQSRPEIKTIVIDTLNGIMISDEMRRIKEKGYDKWTDLVQCVWDIVDGAYDYRDDLTILFLMHSFTERDDNGYAFTKIKTNGKKLEKIQLETKFTTVLLAKCVDGNYIFETHANNSTAKTPIGLYEKSEIPNDILSVIHDLKEYDEGEDEE